MDLLVVFGCVASLIYQHLANAFPQLVMIWEEADIVDIHLMPLLDLHLDGALVPCHRVLLWWEEVALFVLDTDLKEEPEGFSST